MLRMRHCDRKQFKLAMQGRPSRGVAYGVEEEYAQPPASAGSTLAAIVAILGVLALAVMAWLWVAKPYLERQWMTPRFLGHYLLYPEEGVAGEPRAITEDPEPPGTTVANTDNANLFTGHPWKNRGNARREADNSHPTPNGLQHPYLSDIADAPAAMVPALDASGAPLALEAGASMADIREAIKDSGVRTVGIMRQGQIIRVFKPREGASYTMYGKVEGPQEHSVAVFSLPKRQWWWALVEGPTFE